MALTLNGKNYIAQNFGIDNCFVDSGFAWTIETISETGGTVGIVAKLQAGLTVNITTPPSKVGTFTPAQLITANDLTPLTPEDVIWVRDNAYCIGICTPNWQCESPLNGYESDGCGNRRLNVECNPIVCTPFWQCETPLNGWEFDGCGNRRENPDCSPIEAIPKEYEFLPKPTGIPTAQMIFSKLAIKQSMTDYHLEMNKIILHNTSPFPIACALEIRIFKGSVPSCTTTVMPVFRGVNRSTQTNPLTGQTSPGNMRTHIIGIGAGAAVEVSTDYFQPETIVGLHTICLYLHAAWTTEDLEIEMLPIDASELATYPW